MVVQTDKRPLMPRCAWSRHPIGIPRSDRLQPIHIGQWRPCCRSQPSTSNPALRAATWVENQADRDALDLFSGQTPISPSAASDDLLPDGICKEKTPCSSGPGRCAASAKLLRMIKRPTAMWRDPVDDEAARVAAGTLDAAEAFAAKLFPVDMIRDTDEVLDEFLADVAGLVDHRWEPAADAEIFEVIERTVKALNAVNVKYDEAAYETGERELLCAYIENVLDRAGIDVDSLARRHGLTRHEITDEWRDW